MEKTNNDSKYIQMTQTSIPKLIVQLSIPTIISMLVTSVYNLADTAFVGRLGTSASGAVGIVFGFMAIIQSIGFMFGQGGGSIMSRLLGGKEEKEASAIVSTTFFFALFSGIFLEILGFVFRGQLLTILGSTETIRPYARIYITCILIACPIMVCSFVLNNMLRYEGLAALGMVGLFTGAVLNIALDPLLMFGFGWGIAGAGIATATSQFVSFSILLSMFLRKKTQCTLSFALIIWDIKTLGNICATGLPSLLRQSLAALTTMVLNTLAKKYGDPAVAAMSIVSRISMFIFSFGLGIGQGFQPVSAFNYGAKKYKRVRDSYKITIIFAECIIAVMSLVVFLLSNHLIGVFRDDPLVIAIGTRALRLQCAALLFLPFCMVTEMMFQSTGQRLYASLLSAMRNGILFLPSLLILHYFRGLAGIQEAQPLAYVLGLIPSIILLSRFWSKLPKEDEM